MKQTLAVVLVSVALSIHISEVAIAPILNNLGVYDRELEKRIYKSVRNDRQIKRLIESKSTNLEVFNQLVLNKTISVIRSHP